MGCRRMYTITEGIEYDFENCKVINHYGDNYLGYTNHCRDASRAILCKNGNIMLSHETKIGQWMIPGGGREENETPAECCIREVAEETGLIVKPEKCFLIMNEYYEDWKFVSYYFACVATGITERKPTEREIQVGANPELATINEAIDIFSHHQDYAVSDEERRGIYLREYTALKEFMNQGDFYE